MKLYAVTKGDYSAYHIIALTAKKDVAEKLAKQFSKRSGPCAIIEPANVEEYEDGEYLIGKSVYFIRVKNGEVTQIEDGSADDTWIYTEEVIYDETVLKDACGGYYTYVVSDDADKAAKIGKDRIMQYIASRELE